MIELNQFKLYYVKHNRGNIPEGKRDKNGQYGYKAKTLLNLKEMHLKYRDTKDKK